LLKIVSSFEIVLVDEGVDLVFFHLMPEDGDVVAVSDRAFQILYEIFKAVLIISVFSLILIRFVGSLPIAKLKIKVPLILGISGELGSFFKFEDIREISFLFFLLIRLLL
jgi:hypothetical protein